MKNIRLYIGLLAGSAATIWAGSFLPALTNGDGNSNGIVNREVYDAAYGREYGFCKDSVDDVDCQCFANVAGVVIAAEQPKVPGARYPNRRELARLQARDTC